MRRIVSALSVTVLVACGDLPHDNPYDPQAPRDQQARTAFAGTVSLEAVNGVTPSLAGVQVSVAGTGYTATTDAAGAFTIAGVPAGTYTVQAILADYETASVGGVAATLDTGGTTVQVPPIALRRVRADLAGTVELMLPRSVLETTGGANVSLGGAETRAALTGTSGGYVIPSVPAPIGSYTLTASKLGYVAQTATVTFQDGAFVVQPVQLQIDPGAFVGTVTAVARVDGSGNPDASGITVRARGTTLGGTPWEDVTLSGAGGAFRMSGLPAGTYTVSYELADYTPRTTGASIAPGSDTALDAVALAHEVGGLAGTVALPGAPSSAGAVVTATSGARSVSTVTDAAGAFSFPSLETGTWTLSARKDGYVTASTSPLQVSVGATTAAGTVTLALARTGVITGVARVVRPTDDPSSAAILVALTGTDLNGAPVTGSAFTVSGGGYTLTGLPQGTYALAFSKASYAPQQASGIAVLAGAASSAPDVTLQVATGSIAGQVALSAGTAAGFVQGSDFSGVVVTLTGLEPGVTVAAAVTDASGSYRFDGVPVHTAGLPYGLVVQKTGYAPGAASVVAAAGTTVTATPSPLTLAVSVGSVGGNVAVNDTGAPAAPVNGAVTVTVTGSAFNATAFSASATNVGSAFALANLPAGTYDVVATSANRTCTTTAAVTVSAGQALDLSRVPPAYTFVCTDAVAPGAVSLGVPQGPGAQAGFTAATNVDVPVLVAATDATLNLRGYQYVAGGVPSWNGAPVTAGAVSPIPFPAGTLSSDGTWTLWVRAVDQAGNAGPASSVQVVRDATRPADVVLTTARSFVNDTTTTALLSGGADQNFRSYQSCTTLVAATGTCATTPSCTMADAGATFTVGFATANTKACVYARASDRAGNVSLNVQRLEIVSDLIPPTAPVIAPIYDPTLLAVHAPYVDFFLTSGATDAPVGGTTPWKNVAWLEVDTGGGYQPLCPYAGCRDASNVYNPCSCGCTDPRLVCDGTAFKAIRVPLLDGAANSIGVRAVDLAGNVGSGATQQVPTSTSLYPVAVTPPSENNARGRGRLLGYRYTDQYLRLRDLGPDGRPDTADDAACNVGALGAWGGVVPRVAVLGPNVVVHADGDATLNARRPGADGLFCSPAGAPDDTTFAFYAIPASTQVRNVTGSYNYARTGEYAAWLERDPVTSLDTVKVQAPNAVGLLAHSLWYGYWNGVSIVFVYTDPPAPVTLFSPAGTYAVQDLLEGGDCLLTTLATSPRFRVDCKAGGLGSATGVTTWTLPTTAEAATLSADGLLLGWAEYDGATGSMRLHVRSAGADRLYGTADDSDATRLGPGAYAGASSMTLDAGHLVVAESLYQGSYWLVDWNAGPDAVFDGAAGADDTVARVLPSSIPRSGVSLLAGAQVAYSVSGDGGNLSDVLAADLSTYRWETVDATGLSDLATNGAGTRFFQRGSTLTARLPNGTEQQGASGEWLHAATGSSLLTSDGATAVNLRRFTAGSWFGTPTAIYSGSSYGLAAGGKWGLILTLGGGTRYRVTDLSAATPTTTLLPVISGTGPNSNGYGISNTIVAYQCGYSGWNCCVHHPGPDGLFGTADDVTLVLNRPGTTTPYPAYGVAVGGDKVAFSDGNDMIVVATGPDGVFNTADDVAYDLGPIGSMTQGNIAVAGNYAAWLRSTSNGIQVMYADLATGITRQLTTHYSNKESLALDPSGRLTWIDYGFTTPALFVYAP